MTQNRFAFGSLGSFPWAGPACGIASAILYTAANIALRNCTDVDAYLVSAVKAAPTVVLLGPLIVWTAVRRPVGISPLRIEFNQTNRPRIVQFVIASFLAQFFGNVAFQKALEHIGLAASVPITLGVLIVGGAVLGALILNEPVGNRKIIAMLTLIAAVIVLSLPNHSVQPSSPSGAERPGPERQSESAGLSDRPSVENHTETDPAARPQVARPSVVIGSLWAALSGLAYSFFGVTMRQTLQAGWRSSTLMFTSGLTGTVTLWIFCVSTLGMDSIFSTSISQWSMMAAAGIFNFSAFVAITAALRLLPVVAVNLINASQVAMAAVAGVALFGEPITPQLGVGILLTLVGLVILARRTRAPIVITD